MEVVAVEVLEVVLEVEDVGQVSGLDVGQL